MKQNLENILAEGKTARAIQSLLEITKSQDADLYKEMLQISARFAGYERQKRLNLADDTPLSIEHNKINAALVYIVDKLPDEAMSSKTTPSVKEGKTIIQNAEKIYNINHIDNANFS